MKYKIIIKKIICLLICFSCATNNTNNIIIKDAKGTLFAIKMEDFESQYKLIEDQNDLKYIKVDSNNNNAIYEVVDWSHESLLEYEQSLTNEDELNDENQLEAGNPEILDFLTKGNDNGEFEEKESLIEIDKKENLVINLFGLDSNANAFRYFEKIFSNKKNNIITLIEREGLTHDNLISQAENIANEIYKKLKNDNNEYKEITFVAHSLGGIILTYYFNRIYNLTLDNKLHKIFSNVGKINIFIIGSPINGMNYHAFNLLKEILPKEKLPKSLIELCKLSNDKNFIKDSFNRLFNLYGEKVNLHFITSKSSFFENFFGKIKSNDEKNDDNGNNDQTYINSLYNKMFENNSYLNDLIINEFKKNFYTNENADYDNEKLDSKLQAFSIALEVFLNGMATIANDGLVFLEHQKIDPGQFIIPQNVHIAYFENILHSNPLKLIFNQISSIVPKFLQQILLKSDEPSQLESINIMRYISKHSSLNDSELLKNNNLSDFLVVEKLKLILLDPDKRKILIERVKNEHPKYLSSIYLLNKLFQLYNYNYTLTKLTTQYILKNCYDHLPVNYQNNLIYFKNYVSGKFKNYITPEDGQQIVDFIIEYISPEILHLIIKDIF